MNARDQAVINLYVNAHLSFAGVGRKMGMGTSTVQDIMRFHARDKIRSNNAWRNPQPVEELTLTALGLYRVGPCASCGCEIVSYIRERGQVCGLCEAAP